MRSSFIRIKDALTIAGPVGEVEKKKKKITGRHLGVMTWVWPGPLRVSEVQGRNTCYKGGFFSEDSLLSSSPMSFYLLVIIISKLPIYLFLKNVVFEAEFYLINFRSAIVVSLWKQPQNY